jgi:hypothetical protein
MRNEPSRRRERLSELRHRRAGLRLAPQIQNYLVTAILVTLCCCVQAGIVAIVYAAQVNSKLAAGDIARSTSISASCQNLELGRPRLRRAPGNHLCDRRCRGLVQRLSLASSPVSCDRRRSDPLSLRPGDCSLLPALRLPRTDRPAMPRLRHDARAAPPAARRHRRRLPPQCHAVCSRTIRRDRNGLASLCDTSDYRMERGCRYGRVVGRTERRVEIHTRGREVGGGRRTSSMSGRFPESPDDQRDPGAEKACAREIERWMGDFRSGKAVLCDQQQRLFSDAA